FFQAEDGIRGRTVTGVQTCALPIFDPSQLDGLPEDYKKSHPPGPDGKVTITTDYPDYIPFRTYAKDGKARLALYKEFQSRGYPRSEERRVGKECESEVSAHDEDKQQ